MGRALNKSNGSSQRSLTAPRLIGASECVENLRPIIAAVSRRACTVLIHGESGTGKELVARSIHAGSNRAAGPFIPVDCTTLRDTLSESQLFGHTKGAFTGAEQATLGFFRSADGGTLFLDEIGELETRVQAKLLRSIQDSAVVPLGGVQAIPVNVRIVAATHRDLKQMVRDGTFREDLYFRLNVVKLEAPPLRARRGDIVALAEHFLEQQADLYQEPMKTLSPDAIAALVAYDWPGNVRELANAIEHAYVLSANTMLTADNLPEVMRLVSRRDIAALDDEIVPLETAERALIGKALRVANGNQARAAQMLRIERHRLYRKIRLYGLQNLTNPE